MPMPKGFKHLKETKEKMSEIKKGTNNPMYGKIHSKKSRKKMSQPRHKNPMWKNGVNHYSGYIYILKPEHPFCEKNGYIGKSRLIIEAQIGRYLKSKEQCHHLNKIRNDNHPKNLMAFINQSAHQRFHKDPNNVKPKEIIFDGRKL